MTLTPDERERIYQEEKAKRESTPRLFPETTRDDKKGSGCLTIIVVAIIAAVILAMLGRSQNSSDESEKASEPVPVQPQVFDHAKFSKDVAVTTQALHDMKSELAGESMDFVKLTLEVFNGAARLIQTAQVESLTTEERKQVAGLRSALVARQRVTFPIMRDKTGPIFSKQLWISDITAHTLGTRYSTIEFVASDFALHENIAKAHGAILGVLTQLRFKRGEYKWYEDQEEFSYYKIDSPLDGEVAIVDANGIVISVPLETHPQLSR